jgi:hypothetical protein
MSGKSRDRLAPVLTEASSWMSDRSADIEANIPQFSRPNGQHFVVAAHLATSATAVEPSGILYSTSMSAGVGDQDASANGEDVGGAPQWAVGLLQCDDHERAP